LNNFLKTILSVTIVAALLTAIIILDDWLGTLAFTIPYLACCLFGAILVASLWHRSVSKSSMTAGLLTLCALLAPYFLSKPSSRILREVLLETETGTPGEQVVAMLQDAYRDSPYAMPQINHDDRRIDVSLWPQAPGDSTCALFHLADGKVQGTQFIRD